MKIESPAFSQDDLDKFFNEQLDHVPADMCRNKGIPPVLIAPGIVIAMDYYRHFDAIACPTELMLDIFRDTGIAHLALLLQRPSVHIVGGGHFGAFLPYPPALSPANARYVYRAMPCYYCDWACSMIERGPASPSPSSARPTVTSMSMLAPATETGARTASTMLAATLRMATSSAARKTMPRASLEIRETGQRGMARARRAAISATMASAGS